MAQMGECDKLVKSVARFLAGFRPKSGRVYYFEKHRCRHKVYDFVSSVGGLVSSVRCPFCGRGFRRRAAMVTHIISIHYHDVALLVRSEKYK
jgi:hypothetical protein